MKKGKIVLSNGLELGLQFFPAFELKLKHQSFLDAKPTPAFLGLQLVLFQWDL